jgi:hypothetical protein
MGEQIAFLHSVKSAGDVLLLQTRHDLIRMAGLSITDLVANTPADSANTGHFSKSFDTAELQWSDHRDEPDLAGYDETYRTGSQPSEGSSYDGQEMPGYPGNTGTLGTGNEVTGLGRGDAALTAQYETIQQRLNEAHGTGFGPERKMWNDAVGDFIDMLNEAKVKRSIDKETYDYWQKRCAFEQAQNPPLGKGEMSDDEGSN